MPITLRALRVNSPESFKPSSFHLLVETSLEPDGSIMAIHVGQEKHDREN